MHACKIHTLEPSKFQTALNLRYMETEACTLKQKRIEVHKQDF